jgi:hypothetical protein
VSLPVHASGVPTPDLRIDPTSDVDALVRGPVLSLMFHRAGRTQDGYIVVPSIAPRKKWGDYPTRPRTEQGWIDAWTEFEAGDPRAAARYRKYAEDHLHESIHSAMAAQCLCDVKVNLLAGFGFEPFVVGDPLRMFFGTEDLTILYADNRPERAIINYSEILTLEVDGPGAVTTGGGFAGGGFGIVGALEGMAVAGILNALTTKTSITTFIEVQDTGMDLVCLVTDGSTPDTLRLLLKPVRAKLRALSNQIRRGAAEAPAGSVADGLVDLARLYERGYLSADEFAVAKRRLLGGAQTG